MYIYKKNFICTGLRVYWKTTQFYPDHWENVFSWTFFLTFESHKVLISSVKQSEFEASPLYVNLSFFFSADLFDYVLKTTIKSVLGVKMCWKVLFVSRMKNQLLWLHVQNSFLWCLCDISRNWTGGQLYCHLSLYHKMAQWVNVMLMKPGELKGLSHTGLEASRKPSTAHQVTIFERLL